MKTQALLTAAALVLGIVASLAARFPAPAATFTNDASIGLHNTSYDGQDIVVSQGTLTVDGQHGFASVHILAGATLTHSAAANGLLSDFVTVSNELHLLSATNPAVLTQPIVAADTIVVTDMFGTTNYHLGADYLVLTNQSGRVEVDLAINSAIADGAIVAISYEALAAVVPTGLNLQITNDVVIEAGGAINTDSRGWGGGYGTGAGTFRTVYSPYVYTAGGGGGYGGLGGASSSLAAGGNSYGSMLTPTNNGSGGGGGPGVRQGGAGGGSIRLSIGGELRVDGRVTANGAEGPNPHAGGGAGEAFG